MDKNKRLTLLSQCKLSFTGRNVLMALKIQRDINKIYNKKPAQRLFWPRSHHLCHQKPNPARDTVPFLPAPCKNHQVLILKLRYPTLQKEYAELCGCLSLCLPWVESAQRLTKCHGLCSIVYTFFDPKCYFA
jgi:hypothetical protein